MSDITYLSMNAPMRGAYEVTFIENKTKKALLRTFDYGEELLCRQFVNKLKHSKKCTLLSYPALHI